MFKDLRHAVRVLLHAKGWTVVVLLSLALGIGANTAIFTALNALLLKQIPVRDPDTLVRVRWYGKNDMVTSSSDYGFSARDASGQNMVTIATDAICQYISANAPIHLRYYFVEANLSGDKKATTHSFTTVRGRKVTAEVRLAASLVTSRLHTTTERLMDYWRMSALGGVMSGSIGVQGHYANGLAALFIATGQDAACVAEAAVGVTRFEPLADGGLYASVTLPNLIVGTVGGGTGLPTQRACLEIIGLAGAGHARALAEVTAAVALAGELSITGALAAGHFTDAHRRLSRGTAPPVRTSASS